MGQPNIVLTNNKAFWLTMNSWSRLCWPILMSSRSSVEKFLLVPELPQAGRAIRFDPTRSLQGEQVLAR